MRRLGAALCGGMVSLAVPAIASAQAGPVLAGEPTSTVVRYPPTSVRPFLIIGGVGVTGLAYAAGAISAATWSDVPGSEMLYIPVAGPWIALAKNGCAPDDPDCGAILYLRGALYALSGIAQLGGLGLVGEGIFMTTEADAPPKQGLTITPVPIVTGNTLGLGLTGSF